MGFAGAKCIVYLSDGRQIYLKQNREEVMNLMARATDRWPLVKLLPSDGSRSRFVAAAHIVEPKSLESEGGG